MRWPSQIKASVRARCDTMVRQTQDKVADAHFRRLAQCYGFERALAKFKGEDPATQADVAAWRNLGAPK